MKTELEEVMVRCLDRFERVLCESLYIEEIDHTFALHVGIPPDAGKWIVTEPETGRMFAEDRDKVKAIRAARARALRYNVETFRGFMERARALEN